MGDVRLRSSRQRVLSAAAGILRRNGYTGLTMERAAAESGVAKTTLYRHWPTKAALCMDLYLDEAGREVADPDTGHVAAALNAIVAAVVPLHVGKIARDCWHEPYMPRSELEAEIGAGVRFWGWEDEGALIGVMGMQDVKDATLIRHAYVVSHAQRRGIGSALMEALAPLAKERLLVGTWAAAHWAIRFYERHGFRLVPPAEKDRLLETYWRISARQRDTSVVLAHE